MIFWNGPNKKVWQQPQKGHIKKEKQEHYSLFVIERSRITREGPEKRFDANCCSNYDQVWNGPTYQKVNDVYNPMNLSL